MRKNIEAIYSLSPLQEGLLFHSIYAPDTSVYQVQIALQLTGSLNEDAFKQAWQAVLNRHAILRTLFVWEELDKPLQIVLKNVALPWQIEEWRDEANPEARLEAYLVADRAVPFDFEQAPLMRFCLARVAADRYYFVWSVHHILTDGWSTSVILNDLLTYYEAIVAPYHARRVQLPDLPPTPSYQKYIDWLQEQDREQAQRFWQESLHGFMAPTPLMIERPISSSEPNYVSYSWQLSEASTTRLNEFAREHHLTLNTLIQGAWALLLSRYSGMDDVCFGTIVSGRTANIHHIERMVGLLINTLPARVEGCTNSPVLPWLKALQAQQLKQQDYAYTPLVDIQQWSEVPPGIPLFDSIIAFENYPLDASAEEKRALEVEPLTVFEPTHYPLTLIVAPAPSLAVVLDYDASRFERQAIERMAGHYEQLLRGIVEQPTALGASLPLLTDSEKQQLLVEWNQTESDYPRDRCIHQLFCDQVERTPQAVAVVFGHSGEKLTYQALNERANRLAHYLIRRGVGADVLVGLCVERSLDMIVGLLGILKAGAAYVPLDPAYPQERLAFMLRDAGVPILLSQQTLLEQLPSTSATVVCLDRDWSTIMEYSPSNPEQPVSPDHLAYILYTSGSTGRPKGVAIEHHSPVALFDWAKSVFTPAELSHVMASTSICFDLSVFEIFLPLSVGGSVIVVEDALALPSLDSTQPISLINTVPSAMTELVKQNAIPSGVSVVNLAGEPLRGQLVQGIYKSEQVKKVYNLYGPSEDTTYSTFVLTEKGAVEEPTIGRPIANTQAYILDAHLRPLPIGVPGELHLGGAGVARGYWERPDLTADKFVPNPFVDWLETRINGQHTGRLYKTGDLTRYLPDGNIEFLGRIDHQVKVRGFRIELGEIETVLRKHPQVQQLIVVAREDKSDPQQLGNDKQLVAYLTAAGQPTPSALRQFAQQSLPDYMLPSAFVILDAFPLTPNGKINRRALPAPDAQTIEREAFVPPRTPTEEILATLWSQVLKIEPIGVTDDFFVLGGHSLLATQVISRIRTTFEIDLPLKQLFVYPTIAELAQAISEQQQGSALPAIQRAERPEKIPLSFAQQRLWFLSQMEGANEAYNMPSALHIEGRLDIAALSQSLSEIALRHENMQTTFVMQDGQPWQVIHAPRPFTIAIEDLRHLTGVGQHKAVQERLQREVHQPFNLEIGPLWRAKLLQLGAEQYALLLNMHHIIGDGWSLGVWVQELMTLYDAFVQGKPSPLPPLAIQYADFTLWQRTWMEKVHQTQLDYWVNQLADLPRLNLPTDRPRPAMLSFQGGHHLLTIEPSLLAGLKALSQKAEATLFMTLLATFDVLLARYSGQTDIPIGVSIANRNWHEIEPLIGFFVNTLVMRANLSANPSFAEFLSETRRLALEAMQHQDLPFERIVEELQPERNTAYNPLVQVAFALQNFPISAMTLPGLTLNPIDFEFKTAKFDLSLMVIEDENNLGLLFEYSSDLFDLETIQRMAGHYKTLLESVVQNPAQPLSRLPLLTAAEQEQLEQWNKTESDYVRETYIHKLFESQVERTPDAVAVVFSASSLDRKGEEAMTYRELNVRANQVAHKLQSLGVGPNKLVGLCVENSLEMIVGLFGILKAGGAYVPISPTYPDSRLRLMLETADLSVLLTQQDLRERLPVNTTQILSLDSDWAEIASQKSDNPETPEERPSKLVYVIFTSGSTGQPKCAGVYHKGFTNLVSWFVNQFGLSATDKVLVTSSFSFDLTQKNFFAPLLVGGQLHLSADAPIDYKAMGQHISKHQITWLNCTPSAFYPFVDSSEIDSQASIRHDSRSRAGLASLRYLFLGGEPISMSRLRPWLQSKACHATVVNTYGPTESTDVVSSYTIVESDVASDDPIPIGRPISNVNLYILNEERQPVPINVPGELYIGGICVGAGYLNDAKQTNKKFVPNPFTPSPPHPLAPSGMGARLYKTGDLARWRADGNIEFLGRSDYQVKIRGFRIELGEIETVLTEHSQVREAVVMAHQRQDSAANEDKYLVAYVVPETSGIPDWEAEQVSDWQSYYEEAYQQEQTKEDLTFNISGWNSSYTGLPIPAVEMREWVEHTVERILALQPERVLEIGCGSGLLLSRIAPQCVTYWGTDFSKSALNYVESIKQQLDGLAHVQLSHRTADDLTDLAAQQFDTIIINSVVQYFPGIHYLLKVLTEAVQLCQACADAGSNGGHIFIGDVRSFSLLESYHTSVQLYNAEPTSTLSDLQTLVEQQLLDEEELTIAPTFFLALQQHFPQIKAVYIQPKRGTYHNELTRFRYDVILQVGGQAQPTLALNWLDWSQENLSLSRLRSLLLTEKPSHLGLRAVPNARLRQENHTLASLKADEQPQTVPQSRLMPATSLNGCDPEALYALSQETGYHLNFSWASARADGSFEVILSKTMPALGIAEVVPRGRPLPWQTYANNPLQGKLTRNLGRELRQYLQDQMPAYMVPSAFMALSALPLTPNGKVDRKALPQPRLGYRDSSQPYLAPSTETEKSLATIWQEVLGVAEIGLEDNFFELGGHSLLATQVISRIRTAFEIKLPLQHFFANATIAALSEWITQIKLLQDVDIEEFDDYEEEGEL